MKSRTNNYYLDVVDLAHQVIDMANIIERHSNGPKKCMPRLWQ